MVSRLCYCNTFCACATEGVSGFRDLPERERQTGTSLDCAYYGWGSVDISQLLQARMGHEPGSAMSLADVMDNLVCVTTLFIICKLINCSHAKQ